MKYLLQQYEDGTFGYLGIDGNEHYNLITDSKVICTQGKNEDRDEFIAKNNIIFQKNQYGSDLKLDQQVNDKNWVVRVSIALQGYGLDKLIDDEDWQVREAIAWHDYGLDKLINDKNWLVRRRVATRGYGLDKLINDSDNSVREAVAEQGYGLDKLINDEDCRVRREVARHGYGFEKLINDEDKCVREIVAEYLNAEADDNFIIDLGNKLLDQGYKLDTEAWEVLFANKFFTKFKEFINDKNNIYRILIRLLYKGIRIKDIYDPNHPMLVEAYLKQKGLLKDTDSIIDNLE